MVWDLPLDINKLHEEVRTRFLDDNKFKNKVKWVEEKVFKGVSPYFRNSNIVKALLEKHRLRNSSNIATTSATLYTLRAKLTKAHEHLDEEE